MSGAKIIRGLREAAANERADEAELRLRAIAIVLDDTDPDASWHRRQNEIRQIIQTGGSASRREQAKTN